MLRKELSLVQRRTLDAMADDRWLPRSAFLQHPFYGLSSRMQPQAQLPNLTASAPRVDGIGFRPGPRARARTYRIAAFAAFRRSASRTSGEADKVDLPRSWTRSTIKIVNFPSAKSYSADSPALFRYTLASMPPPPAPSSRKLAAIASIVLFILFWAAFVATLAPFVSRWPILVQAPYYLIMGTIWIIPLKPLIRWSESGHFRAPRE
jgi:hypothetical protein